MDFSFFESEFGGSEDLCTPSEFVYATLFVYLYIASLGLTFMFFVLCKYWDFMDFLIFGISSDIQIIPTLWSFVGINACMFIMYILYLKYSKKDYEGNEEKSVLEEKREKENVDKKDDY